MDELMIQPGIYDFNKDGQNDALCFEWNGRKALFISDDGKLPEAFKQVTDFNAFFNEAFLTEQDGNPWNPMRIGWGSYTLLVDRDGCGKFDTQGDWCYRAFDINHDGLPEAEYYHLFPGQDWCPWSNKLVINLDGEPDMSYLDFKRWTYANEQRYGKGGKYYMNVHGSGFFLNSYSPHTTLAWETPIAWYDFNRDGRTELVMRVGDTWNNQINCSGGLKVLEDGKRLDYSGYVSEFEIAYELNGNTSEEKYHSLDLMLSFYRYKRKGEDGLNYQVFPDRMNFMKPLPGTEEFHGKMAETRLQLNRKYLPYLDGYKIGTEYPLWEGVLLLMDEDDDDCRWEEMFSNHEGECGSGEPGWRVFGDQLGDRTELDTDYQGRAMLYVSPMDGRIHLYHSEFACWEQDPYALYKGSRDHLDTDEGPIPPAGLVYTQVRYYDTTGDGYIDTIEYALAKYGTEERKVIRRVHVTDQGRPCLFDPRSEKPVTGWKVENWDGNPLSDETFAASPAKDGHDRMKAFYAAVCENMAKGALMLYETASALGLTQNEFADTEPARSYTKAELEQRAEYPAYPGYSRHVQALKNQPDLRSQYNDGYWLREKVFEDICAAFEDPAELEELYYSGQYGKLCEVLKAKMA